MNWQALLEFFLYAGIGVVSFALWWLFYEFVLTRGISTREAIFGRSPNLAVALDLFGGFAAMGVLNHFIISGPALSSMWLDVEATALTLLGTMLLLGLLRWLCGEFLRLWFGQSRDAHGHLVTFNNEIFVQRNVATGLFSTALYLVLVAGLVEEDLLNMEGDRFVASMNMLGVWVLGFAVIVLHSWLYLGLGGRHHILHESFHHNNVAAPASLLGLLCGALLLNHQLLVGMPDGAHMFNQGAHWLFLLLGMVGVVLLRGVLALLLRAATGVRLRDEMLQHHNAAWGVLDGGLIFSLMLILMAVIV